jgi:catechol 2,3-dioxygenase-like lactoylglutathione lyase family enzyme
MQFDHVGIPTNDEKPGAIFVAATRVWITDAHQHPFRVEWLRYEPDSPVKGPLREQPHIGYRVDDVRQITELSRGMRVLLEPFDAGFAVAGFFQTADGANIELVWYRQEPPA